VATSSYAWFLARRGAKRIVLALSGDKVRFRVSPGILQIVDVPGGYESGTGLQRLALLETSICIDVNTTASYRQCRKG
jgi:hypothetical protein